MKKVGLLMIKAVQFQYNNKKRNFSLFDCVGYVFSLESNCQFVTGDKEFKGVANVLFMQK